MLLLLLLLNRVPVIRFVLVSCCNFASALKNVPWHPYVLSSPSTWAVGPDTWYWLVCRWACVWSWCVVNILFAFFVWMEKTERTDSFRWCYTIILALSPAAPSSRAAPEWRNVLIMQNVQYIATYRSGGGAWMQSCERWQLRFCRDWSSEWYKLWQRLIGQ